MAHLVVTLAFFLVSLAGCVVLDPQAERDREAYLYKGKRYLERGNVQMALSALHRAQKIDPEYVPILVTLGIAYDRTGQTERSLEMLRKAQRIRPTDGEINNNLGVALFRMGKIDEAEQAFLKALKDDNSRSDLSQGDVYFNLSLVFEERGEMNSMEQSLKNAVATDASHVQAHVALARLYGKQQDPHKRSEARRHIRAALVGNPGDPKLLAILEDLTK